MLKKVFDNAEEECRHDVAFSPNHEGQQKNECRDSILAYLKKCDLIHGRHLAKRLQAVTTNRSGFGLLFLMDRFIAKAQKDVEGRPKYEDPLKQIQDQLGARIVTFYKSDVEKLTTEVKKYFSYIETEQIVLELESEFGYEGRHFILFIPRDIFDDEVKEDESITFFELQIKTLFQHAWSEAEHDLGYKPSTVLSSDQEKD